MPTTEEERRKLYRREGFGGRLGFGQAGAVLVVDFQRSFVDPAFIGGADMTEAITATGRLLDKAREARLPIFFTIVSYAEHLEDAGLFVTKCPSLRTAIESTNAVELDSRLNRRDYEPLVVKKHASAFFGTTLASMLASAQVDTLIICGCTTSGCVRASVVDSMQHGFRPIVPEECVCDIAEEPHTASLFDIDGKYGDVVSSADAIQRIPELVPYRGERA